MSLSGKFIIRMPPRLHDRLKKFSSRQAQSLNEACVQLLNQALQKSDSAESDDFKRHVLTVLRDKLKEDLIACALFGSVARGEATASSDVDLLIVVGESLAINRSLYRQFEDRLETWLGLPLSLHFVHLPQPEARHGSLWLEVAMNCKILFDPEQRLQNLLLNIREQIAEQKYRRKKSSGVPYWLYNGAEHEK